ncbi:MAG: YXWGXW repeat-containing protein [Candidatus Omnitrophica bacterium]|nr:YXWGXW repeat-containing protein [Candidatus Omnitrophota bacterium]
MFSGHLFIPGYWAWRYI